MLFPLCDIITNCASNRCVSLRNSVANFAIGSGRAVCEKVYELLYDPAIRGPAPFVDAVSAVCSMGTYAGNFEMVVFSLLFDIDVIVYSNYATGVEIVSTASFLSKHLPDASLSSDLCLHVYHHQYMRPLIPVPLAYSARLNHFALLLPVHLAALTSTQPGLPLSKPHDQSSLPIEVKVTESSTGSPDLPFISTMAEVPSEKLGQLCPDLVQTIKAKSYVQTSMLQWFQKPTSTAGKRKGLSVVKQKCVEKRNGSTRMTAEKQAGHVKNMSITMKWADLMGVNKDAALVVDAACADERRRRIELSERQSKCQDLAIIAMVVSNIIEKVENQILIANVVPNLPNALCHQGVPKN